MNAIDQDHLVDLLEETGRLLELKGENPFKVRAYLNAARALETYPGSLATAAREGKLAEIPGIGKAIAEKIAGVLATGEFPYHAELKAAFPATLFDLFELQGLGAKKIRVLYEQLAVVSIETLEAACADGRLAALPGFGAKTAANLQEAIAQRRSHAGQFLYEKAAVLAETLREELRAHPAVAQLAVAGSYRRHKETIGDLDFVVATAEPEAVSAFFIAHPLVEGVIASGATKSSVRLSGGLQADLRVVSSEAFPFALNYFTGSKEHNIQMRSRALQRGWTLNEYRLANTAGEPVPEIREEKDLYRALDLDYIEPELRENLGEFAAAEAHTLPRLVELANLRGTFHNHTTASDGRHSLEEMAEAARELGLSYLGIADHSKSSFQAHGLDEARLAQQVEAIGRLNAGYGGGFRLFTGVECDILPDGSLDFDDDTLAGLDYVVASVHSGFNLPEAAMTARIIRAISNPYVTMLGHPTGRLLLSRKPYPVDIPAIIEAAAQTGTLIEINCAAPRMELDWRWWPLAREKGVRCSINPDAHSVPGLQRLAHGIGIARKGWLTREDVVNCLPLEQIGPVLAAKRSRR